MKKRVACTAVALAAVSIGWGAEANAQSAGSIVLNAGWFHLAPQDRSDPLKVSALGTTATVPNSGASVSDSDTGGLTVAYFFTDHISVEGVFGVPPKLDLSGSGSLAPLGKLGSAREWSPTLLLRYHFGNADAPLRPYVGAGASYVWYSSVNLTSGMGSGAFLASPQTGNLLTGRTTADLSSSLVPVLNGGMTYKFTKHWSINASVSYLFLSTKATLTTQSAVGTIRSETKLHVNPIVTFVSVGYTF